MSKQTTAPQWFVTTHWSVVMGAQGNDSSRIAASLAKLCQTYWYPLYAFVRRAGYGPHDAQDLVQSFFAECLEKDYFAVADPEKGRFRSFLLIAFKRFLAKAKAHEFTLKRGGGKQIISLDALTPEQRYAAEPSDNLSPERLFERRWAFTLLQKALSRLEGENRDQKEFFQELLPFLTSSGRGTPYAEIANRYVKTEASVKVTIHRLRKRYKEILQEEIANTVLDPKEIQEERNYLLRVISGDTGK